VPGEEGAKEWQGGGGTGKDNAHRQEEKVTRKEGDQGRGTRGTSARHGSGAGGECEELRLQAREANVARGKERN
jgi:hypothetical protein